MISANRNTQKLKMPKGGLYEKRGFWYDLDRVLTDRSVSSTGKSHPTLARREGPTAGTAKSLPGAWNVRRPGCVDRNPVQHFLSVCNLGAGLLDLAQEGRSLL